VGFSHIGRRWEFPPHLGDRNRMSTVDGDTAIKQSIQVIIYTIPGERVMHPEFGCELHSLIFHPANEQTAATAERYVREALERWEPRINIKELTVVPGSGSRGELFINMSYEIKGKPDPRSLVLPYYLIPLTE
jgi:uncharacterized protein